jgi:hypothetical protein
VSKKRVLVVFPTAWDELQFQALPPEVRARYELVFDEPRDEEVRWDFDVLAYLEERARRWRTGLDGVFSSSDYPGAIAAAALARELGLPGAPPEAVLRAGHKFYAREAARSAVPEAVPRYRLFDPSDERTWPPADEFPCFVKPVKASFSLFARRVADRDALAAFTAAPELHEFRGFYVRLFERLAARYAALEHGAHLFLAEGLLQGDQVTVEGFVRDGIAQRLGIVDTTFHPGTASFASFDYPSHLAASVQERLWRVAAAQALVLGLENTLFNVELFHDPSTDRIGLIEINPRLCGQFGDLYAKVDGRSGFELALALCCGEEPRDVGRGAAHAAAASVPLRIFRSARARAVPGTEEWNVLQRDFSDALVWSDIREGDELCVGPAVEDGVSVRYGVVNLGGVSRADIARRLAELVPRLGFRFAPLESPS